MGHREKSMEWWNKKSLEQRFYITIKNNDFIVGDKTRHPDTLTGSEIETLYKRDELYNKFFQNDKEFKGRCFRKRDGYIWYKDEAYEAIDYYLKTGIEP